MNSFSPTSAGFRLIFRRPAIPLAEIAWRWSFAAGAWVLGMMFLFEYMDSLPVTRIDRLLLRTRQPALVARALHRIFSGSAFRFTEAGVLLAIALGIAWVILASLGRTGTVEAIVDEFKLTQLNRKRGPLPSLLALNVLRAAVTMAAVAGAAGAVLISNSFWASTHISPADASRIFFLILFFVWLAWAVLNWLLSTAGILVVTERNRALAAIAATVQLCYTKPLPVVSAGALFGLLHVGAFIAASAMGFMILGALGSVPVSIVLFMQIVLVLVYCAVADFFYMGRLAAYVLMIRGEEAIGLFESQRVPPPQSSGAGSRVSQDELILSDVPLPAG